MTKAEKAKATKQANAKRRSNMSIKTIELKVSWRKLPKDIKQYFIDVFNEAKWFENYLIGLDDNSIYDVDYSKLKSVSVHYKTNSDEDWSVEDRKLSNISSQMKQGIQTRITNNISGLHSSKKNGRKVGKLKFKSEVNSIPLKQYNNTYYLDLDTQRIKLQKYNKWIRVRGMDQFKLGDEFANANLVRKPDGIYLYVTVYRKTEKVRRNEGFVGIDFGMETTYTLSTGDKINALLPETERLKYLQKKKSRQVKGSNNSKKIDLAIKKEYQKIANRKNDSANKFVSELVKNFSYIFFQDENLNAWKKKNGYVRGGKKVQHSTMGRVKSKLRNVENAIMLPKNAPTTALCPVCDTKTKHLPEKRTFSCPNCGYELDRDLHSTLNMIIMGMPCITEYNVSKKDIVMLFEKVLKNLVNVGKLAEAEAFSLLNAVKRVVSNSEKQEDTPSLVVC